VRLINDVHIAGVNALLPRCQSLTTLKTHGTVVAYSSNALRWYTAVVSQTVASAARQRISSQVLLYSNVIASQLIDGARLQHCAHMLSILLLCQLQQHLSNSN
jgi:hypothetical protein